MPRFTCLALYAVSLMTSCWGTYLDLSFDFNERTIYWPSGQTNFKLETLFKGEFKKGIWLQTDQFCSGIHVGTHMDSPNHFAKDALTIPEIPISKLIAPAVIVDIRYAASQSADSNVTLADVQAWETAHGRIPRGALVLQCSGWTERYPDKARVYGNDREDTTDFHFPAFDVDAVKWLIDERQIVGVGSDTPSVDYGPNSDVFPVHRLVSSHNLYILENVKDTCKVPPAGATIFALPSKIAKASGAATRVIASWDTSSNTGSSVKTEHRTAIVLVTIMMTVLGITV